MNRQRLALVLVALCCVLAFGMVAATLDSPSRVEVGQGAGEGDDIGDEGRFSLGSLNATGMPGSSFTVPPVVQRILVAVTAVMALISVYVAYRRYGLDDLVTLALVGFVVIAFVAVFLRVVDPSQFDALGGLFTQGEFSILSEGGETVGDAAASGRLLDPPAAVMGILLLVLLVGVAVIVQTDPSPSRAEVAAAVDDPPPDPQVAAVGRAAGRAADDVAGAGDPDVSNAVYRAWYEMTDALAVDAPESSTPGEFAAAAVEAGMDPDDVAELTELFEEVRYGDAPPSPERERRALDVLRRIERTYAGEVE